MIPNITAGETINYTQSFDGFDPSADTLTFECVTKSSKQKITATNNGDGSYRIIVPYATTIDWKPGDYSYQANIRTAADEQKCVEKGTFEVEPSFEHMSSGYDDRSHIKKTLDALEATIEGKASQDQLSYSIAGRSLSRLSPIDLLMWRDKYLRFKSDEDRAQSLANGEMKSTKSFVRMPA